MVDLTESHYSTGTATVAAGGTAVTGQGTAWAGAVRPGDLFGSHVGLPIRILSVESNTGLTLAHPWPGDAQAAAPYEIQRTPYDVGYRKAIEDLVTGISEGNVPLLAALTAAANKLPYFDSDDTMALTDISAKARALLSQVDAEGMLGEIEAQPLDDGLTAISALVTAAFGRELLTGTDAAAVRDLLELGLTDTVTLAALLLQGGSAVGLTVDRPGSATNSVIELKTTAGSVFIGQGASGRFAVKGDANVSVAPWLEVSADGPLIGGAKMIDGGSNANGRYARFSNGMQICWNPNIGSVDVQQANGPLFISSSTLTWTYPAAFAAAPGVAPSINASTRWGTTPNINASQCELRALSTGSSSIASTIGAFAAGRYN